MKVTRFYDETTNLTLEEVLTGIIDKQIDTIIQEAYSNSKVSSASSSHKGEVVA